MKKILAILLSLMLLTGCAAGIAEETESAQKVVYGVIRANGDFTLQGILPDGYRIIPFRQEDDALLAWIQSDDPVRPVIMLSIGYDETYADVDRLNDMSDEELALLEKTFTDTDPFANITYDETALGTRLMICRATGVNYDALTVLTIYRGYFVEATMTPGQDAPEQLLTEEQIAQLNVLLSDMDFVPGIDSTGPELSGATYDALITGFDAEAKTLDVTILVPVTLTEWELVSIDEGDTIRIGDHEVEITTLVYEEDDTRVIINDEFFLTLAPSGLYTASDLEFPLMEEALTATLSVPDSLVFVEDIDPETGVVLEESRTLTVDDLFAALAVAREGGVGFDAQNVTVSFGPDGDLTRVERYYAPWQ